MMSKVFEATLTDGVEYTATKTGTMETAYELSFKAPNYKCRDASIELRTLLTKNMIKAQAEAVRLGFVSEDDGDDDDERPTRKRGKGKAQDKSQDQEDDDIKSPGVIELLLRDDLNKALALFDKIALHTGVIKAESDITLKRTHLERMSEEDYLNVALGYIGFFTMKSVESRMNAI